MPSPEAAIDRTDANRSEPTPPALELSGIVHDFDRLRAVDDVSLRVRSGEVVCLLGPSGCGKSTLLRIAAGLEELQHGSVRIDGREMREAGGRTLPPERRNVGLMFQDSALFPHLSVLDNVAFGLDRMPARRRRARAMEILGQVGMAESAGRFPHRLSGGQQQRVALARALAPGPGLILLDEPFSALDARLRGRIRDDTLHLLKQAGSGTLLVTHDAEEAMFMADRIALMRDGRLLQTGTPSELYCSPDSPFVASFFGDVNELGATVRDARVETALGPFDAAGLAEGSAVRVLIRPEAIEVRINAAGRNGVDPRAAAGRVVMARLLGRSSLLHLSVPGPDDATHHVHALVPGVFLPSAGDPVELHVDPSRAFVFPAGDG